VTLNKTLALSLGSNIDAQRNIRLALDALARQFSSLSLSSVYESESIGFDGDNFLNLVVVVETDLSLVLVQEFLKQLEESQGRDRTQAKFSSRPIDVDILFYGSDDGASLSIELPRAEITRNAFVLLPLAELLPDAQHAPTGKTYAELWASYDKDSQKLWPIEFAWP
jgi:2-amino-4-hydroxy-6-hydroxymethyldihydropteridine diphosphokinase